MKKLIFISTFLLAAYLGKTQSIRIYVSEKESGSELPVAQRAFEITINDTIKLNLSTSNNGLLGKIELDPGKYKIQLQNKEYQNAMLKDVLVEAAKTSNITIYVVPITANKEEEIKKVEEK